MTDARQEAIVTLRRDLDERLAIVRVTPDGWALPDFEPGQFATLGLPDPEGGTVPLKRVYSIASAPGTGYLEFYIQLVKEGRFTSRLWTLEEGNRLFLAPRIAGRFTLEDIPTDADLMLVGTGTGVAPFVSMARCYAGRSRWRRCAVVHGARQVVELGYRRELTALAADDDLAYVPLVTREPAGSGWTGLRGRVQLLLEDGLFEEHAGFPLDPARCHVFLCGNPEMIDDMERLLLAQGFSAHTREAPGNLHFERWW